MDIKRLKKYYYDERAPWRDPDIHNVESLYMWYLEQEDQFNKGNLCEVPSTSWGDYVGSTVERSNHRCWIQMFDSSQGDKWWDVHGDFFSHMIVVSRECLENPQDDIDYKMIEVVKGLQDYPCIDDEDMSFLESDLEDEAWDDWVKRDLLGILEKEGVFTEEQIDSIDNDSLRCMFSQAMENANEYPIFEDANGPWYHLDRIVAHWTTVKEA